VEFSKLLVQRLAGPLLNLRHHATVVLGVTTWYVSTSWVHLVGEFDAGDGERWSQVGIQAYDPGGIWWGPIVIDDGSHRVLPASSGPALADGTPHTVTVTDSGAEFVSYFDGSYDRTRSYTDPGWDIDATQFLLNGTGNSDFANMAIYALAVYRRVLSTRERLAQEAWARSFLP
jgi:hypothetical protein